MVIPDHPNLTREEENALFTRLVRLRTKDHPHTTTDAYKELRKYISGYFIKLMLQCAGIFARKQPVYDADILIADATIILYNAIDYFEPKRGNRFSTYSVWCLRRSLPKAIRGRMQVETSALLENMASPPTEEICFQDHNDLRLAVESMDDLRDREIILRRFGFIGQPETLDAVGKRLGVGKERIRQLEKRALDHLRTVLT